MTKRILFPVLFIAVIGVGFLISFGGPRVASGQLLNGVRMTVFKSPTCGCCGNYISYLEKQGAHVSVEEVTNTSEIKKTNGVPFALESCHTTQVEGYVVEGHVPAEAIKKILDERPDIAGISLPEMPAGSPGMSGTKLAPFRIHSFTAGVDTGLFMEL